MRQKIAKGPDFRDFFLLLFLVFLFAPAHAAKKSKGRWKLVALLLGVAGLIGAAWATHGTWLNS